MTLGTTGAVGMGVAIGATVAGGIALAARGSGDGAHATRAVHGVVDPHAGDPYIAPYVDPYAVDPGISAPGNGPGDERLRMPVRGHIDPPGWFDDYVINGSLDGDRLRATIDPRGWFNDIDVSGRVDQGGFSTRIDPRGWNNDTSVHGQRTYGGYDGSVDRPGLWNDVRHPINETIRGAHVLREGRFDERLVPGFSEASWRSFPNDAHGGSRTIEFDPPGWGNTTRVTLEGNAPAGVEATVAAHLFDAWKTELERQAEYPDPAYPGPSGPGDERVGWDPSYPTVPGSGNGPGDL